MSAASWPMQPWTPASAHRCPGLHRPGRGTHLRTSAARAARGPLPWSLGNGGRSGGHVAQVEERCGVGRRRLERLFEQYIGATPKWVLARYRIHDAVSDLDAGYVGSLADLTARYGWFDQAHFTREFTDLVGVPPGAYRGSS